jgi:periplasmic protein TonB
MNRARIASFAALAALSFAVGCGASASEAPAPRIPETIAVRPAKPKPLPPVAEPVHRETVAPDPAPEIPETPPLDDAQGEPNGVPGGVPGEVVGDVPRGVVGGVPRGVVAVPDATPRVVGGIPGVIPFGPGMNYPRKLSGRDIAYTKDAVAAGVSGDMIVKCVITTTGALRACRIIKGLPYLDAAVLATLATQTYEPVIFQGKAVSVDKVFTIRFRDADRLPPPPPARPQEHPHQAAP